jgi:Fe-S cluster assembly ATP-binding protein
MFELKNVNVKTKGAKKNSARQILSGINFSISAGELVVVTGPNGSGKSTLAKVIMGIEQPTGGQILFNGTDITRLGITERAKLGIGFAFQQPVNFKGLTVKDMFRFALGQDLTVDKACEYLSRVGLCAAEYIDRELSASLSGGEMKRIEIALLLARGSKLSIFDEPEAGIDLWSFNSLVEIFESLRKNNKSSIIIISHQERILNMADKIAVMSNGQIIEFGARDKILPTLNDMGNCQFGGGGCL